MTISGAWHAEIFARQKELKQLDHYLNRPAKPTKPQTDDEIAKSVMSWIESAGAGNSGG